MSKYCSKCGRELHDDSQFCDGCGSATNEVYNTNQINSQEIENKEIVSNQNGEIVANKNKSSTVKKIIIIACIIAGLLLFASVAAKPIYRSIRDANTRSQIDIHAEDEYIEIDQEKFGKLLANELLSYGINVSTVHKYKGTKWADKYRFDIDLENGEKIYLTGNQENRIERIICRGDPKADKSSLGNVVGVITMLLVPSTTNDDLEKLNKTFFKYNNLNSMFGEDYRYGNLVYEWYWDKLDNTFFQITIMTEGQYKAINSN